ncbi:HAD superfamily, subfamily IIIB (Acid phosphatase) [Streptomyces sp. Ag82_O1-12]|uniref:HAD family acid phosphatase n=1 Tax=unclassified Streptomyces TaxID=2593676 RepID=UPI000BDB5AE3|nr:MULTISPECIES: HAD family acid phosphatase [unclassified Streptomyces]SMQ17989.1 HAD superfamily, subfamily IIIB (Acid phosphatase) [Streptomyces sp. Ag82_O1-12]SOD47026.1 HAD superfamily, subfamily IIIB (Acid phosphatase) [Streptomyces sp. Ag82_G6-1]
MQTRRPWLRRASVTAVSAAALVAMAAPADATTTSRASTAATATATTSTAADVDYDTWQKDCQAVMDQAMPYLKQRIAATKPGEKQAIVFDIDNTTLETDFGFSYPQPANKPVLEAARYAQERGVALFFVTARPDIIASFTQYNLKQAGYQVSGLYVRGFIDLFKNVADYKTAQRVDVERKGYTIIANIGNSGTDLSGGHAERTYKLPDYDGQLS